MRRNPDSVRAPWLASISLSALLACLGSVAAAAAAPADSGQSAKTFAVRPEGRWTLVLYATNGTARQRFTGFEHISDFAPLDDSSVLVAEEEGGRLTAVGFDGRLLFETPARRPRCLQVLAPDRFLVCLDGPAAVAEIDRTGRVLWELAAPLVDAAGAVRLPDGNTAVVEGRSTSHAVRVFSPDGKLLWSGTDQLAQPRGLTLLPSGELVTSGFDTARIVFFQPYTNKVRTLQFCCHGDKPTSRDGAIIIASNELQMVRGWDRDGKQSWEFSTFYPPLQGMALADGSVLVSEYRVPDRKCLNAAAAADWARAPLAPYWRSLLAGLGAAVLL
ncbi:MAG TPA: PQQ-binding-like beta-propeller repeat protein, partial [Candidatus Binatia bacterium]|nr:PQQ-binding-like beta-propeller repeat protein [Candidatus Binatia bacterium]